MKNKITLFAILFSLFTFSSCYLDLDIGSPYIAAYDIYEYETSEIIVHVPGRGYPPYEEHISTAWLSATFENEGSLTARNIRAEFTIFDNWGNQSVTVIPIENLSPGESTIVQFDTGYHFIDDYSDYSIDVYWD